MIVGQMEQGVIENKVTEVQKGPIMDSGFYSGGSRETRNCRVLAESHNLSFQRFTSAAVLRMD